MNSSPETRPVLVGFDGSDVAYAALDFALDEASRRHTDVVVLLASGTAMLSTPVIPMMTEWPDEGAKALLGEARAHAATRSPRTTVHTETALSGAPAALVDCSSRAGLVVIGGSRHSHLGEFFLGATAPQVAAHAHCPVIIVPSGEPAAVDAPVVVGVDGSSVGATALEFAFGQARDTARPLVALHAWWLDAPDRLGLSTLSSEMIEGIEHEQREATAEAVDVWSAKFPDVRVDQVTVRDDPVRALLKAGETAALIVVGSRGHGGFAGLIVGSVTQGLLHRDLACPVAVVHAAAHK